MAKGTLRTLGLAGGAAWVLVAASAVKQAAVDEGDDWEGTYFVFSAALLIATALTVAVVARATRETSRPRLRRAGLVLAILGVLGSFVAAWAYPLWMTLLGAGLALVAVASTSHQRRGVGLLAGGQLAGLAVMLAGILAHVGRRDDYGDYPVPGDVGVVIAALTTIAGLVVLTQILERRPTTPSSADPALAGLS